MTGLIFSNLKFKKNFLLTFTIILYIFIIYYIHIQLLLKDWTTELESHTKSIHLTLKHDILRLQTGQRDTDFTGLYTI